MRPTTRVQIAALVAASLGSVAYSQPVWVSGLEHASLGGAVLMPPTERRLPVRNLGSSGEDGVEVKLRSVMGGTVSVDIGQMLTPSPSSRQVRVRPKGWDGTIKGSVRLASNPGTPGLVETWDFSMLPGVIGLDWRLLDGAGNVLAEGTRDGAVMDIGLLVPSTGTAECNKAYRFAGPPASSDGSPPAARDANQGFFDRVVTVSGLTPVPMDGVREIAVRTRMCLGCPPPFVDMDSMEITGGGMSEFTVADAALDWSWGVTQQGPATMGSGRVLVWGTWQGHVSEETGDLDGDGAPDRYIRVSNIGSSGEDGVAVDLPPSTQSVGRKWGNGHVTLMKFTDDEGEEMRILHTENPGACVTDVTPDCSSLGAAQCLVQCRDQFGNVVMEGVLAAGQAVSVHECMGPQNSTAECRKAGGQQQEYYTITMSNDVTCSFPWGVASGGIRSVRLSPLGGTGSLDSLRSMSITSPDGTDIVMGALAITLDQGAPPCDPDVNQDGNVDQDDVVYLINVVGGGGNPTGIDPDFNQDGNIDQDDVTALINVVAGGACP
jgi:hypothetical protein